MLSGVSSNRKNSYSKAAFTPNPMAAALSSARRSVPRGQMASAACSNSPRKNSMFSSKGSSRQLSGTIRTGASG